MSRSNKGSRPKTPDALQGAKNKIRGAPEPLRELFNQKKTISPREVAALAEWAPRGVHSRVWQCAKPKTLAALSEFVLPAPDVLERELEWCRGLLRNHLPNIGRFLNLRKSIEGEYLFGSPARALEYATQLESECGQSFASCGMRITLTHIVEGLEAQKRLAAGYRIGMSTANAWAVFIMSLRAESHTDAPRLIQMIYETIEGSVLDTRDRALLNFLITNKLPEEDDLGHFASALIQVPAIDTYEALVSVGVVSCLENRSSSPHFARLFAEWSQRLDDPRLAKALFWLDERHSLEAVPDCDLSLRDSEFCEPRDPLGPPRSLEDMLLPLRPDAPEPRFNSEMHAAQIDAGRRIGNAADDALGDLTRAAFALSNMNCGRWLWQQCRHMTEPTPEARFEALRLRWAYAPSLDPDILPYLPPQRRQTYFDALTQRYGATLSVQVAGFVAGLDISRETSSFHDRLPWLELQRALAKADHCQSIDAARTIRAMHSHNFLRLPYWTEIACLTTLGKFEEAMAAVSSIAQSLPAAVSSLPCNHLHEEMQDSGHTVVDHLHHAILLDLCVTQYSAPLESSRSYAYEDFLNSMGVTKPSELDCTAFADLSTLVYFLRNLCVPEVMQLSLAFTTSAELVEERARICGLLVQLDPDRADDYQSELREIVRQRHITSAVRELQQSKITVNEDALSVELQKSTRNEYERLQLLLASGMYVTAADFQGDFLRGLRLGPVKVARLTIPENEASTLLLEILTRMLSEFYLNAEYGLDCYLSMRIRHGTLSGQLRGPLEREALITHRDASNNSYKSNEHWRAALKPRLGGDDEAWSAIDAQLRMFSEEWDAIIEHLTKELIQVRREEKPAGLFRGTLPSPLLVAVASRLSSGLSFEDFVALVFESCWFVVEEDLERIRHVIDANQRAMAFARLAQLEEAIESIACERPVPELTDAIRRSRTEVSQAFDRLRDWFARPRPLSAFTADLDELIDIGVESVRIIHREFQPRLEKNLDSSTPPLFNALVLFSDIFFILFDNIHRHSGDPVSPEVQICSIQHEDRIEFIVENDLSPEVDVDALAEKMKARSAISRRMEMMGAATREGGTGLYKLEMLLTRPGAVHYDYEFGVSNRKFFVRFSIGVRVVQHASEVAG